MTIFDENGLEIADGAMVRVNSEHEGMIHLADTGAFTVDGWPEDRIIEVLEIVEPLPIDNDTIHPTIKE